MKLGIIGTGMIVENFLPFLVKMEGLEIKALLSTPRSLEKAREMADRFSIADVTADFEELCGMDIDTVYVAVPNFMHFDYCRKALQRKLNVIVEKPMVSSLQEAAQLKQLAEENQCFLFEAITTLYLGNWNGCPASAQSNLPRANTASTPAATTPSAAAKCCRHSIPPRQAAPSWI